ncbi:DNA adenine methylase [Brevundimonas sp.]|uniref:DNA adenine methylase n=1 Tax=Brevundimonas sp. TaxID=1871086 RepID=UPI00286A3511|nr:DNA adenine methylase [Brevundimonas sp.]
MSSRTRPPLRYFGSKFRLARKLLPYFPPHDQYGEPFGGSGSVLLHKPRSRVEIYNDLDDDLVNLFRVLRQPGPAAKLTDQLRLTPYSRSEFVAAYVHTDEPVERARRMIVRSFMGHSSIGTRIDRTTGFRACNPAAHGDPAKSWATYPDALQGIIERIRGVSIEQLPALDLIAQRDGRGVLWYVDPPYVHSTRSEKTTRAAPSAGYRHELSDADHVALLETLLRADGMVILSGYHHPIYADMLSGWEVVELEALAEGGSPRTEVLWINPAATRARAGAAVARPADLFGVDA